MRGLQDSHAEKYTIPLRFSPLYDGPVTLDEFVMIAVALAVLLSCILALLRSCLIVCLRLPCLKDLLMKIEVHAEVAAMDNSMRRAMSSEGMGDDRMETGKDRFRPSPNSRARGNVANYAPSLILAETKAASSKAQDQDHRRNAPKEQPQASIAKGASKGRYGRGQAGGRADKKGKATLVYPGNGVCANDAAAAFPCRPADALIEWPC